ncbi:hypothetical protein [Streptomyces sp. KL116D]
MIGWSRPTPGLGGHRHARILNVDGAPVRRATGSGILGTDEEAG